jgi:hypothetical protein
MSTIHMPAAARKRPLLESPGYASAMITAPKKTVICDRSSRWINNCRRVSGAGNRNCVSARLNSSSEPCAGNAQLADAAASSSKPTSAGPDALRPGTNAAGVMLRRREEPLVGPANRVRAKMVK